MMMFDVWGNFGNTEEYEKQIIFKLYLIEITFTRQILIENNPTAMLRIFLKKTQR